jgi:molybdopterin converting factor subunit 1
MPIEVKVLFFGRLREAAGLAQESARIPAGSGVEDLFTQLTAHHPEIAKFRASLVASRNQEFVPWDATLHAGDEIAFLPPVSGG